MIDRLPNETVLRGELGDYRLLSMVGRGGMGVVYRAQRTGDGTIWALKEMRPPPETPPDELAENRRLFVQEATTLQLLRHPNIVLVAEQFEYEGRPCMVMEFVAGQTLEQRLHEANAPLLEQQVLPWGIQLCRVLSYIHTLTPPIVYRDLKPPNVMLTPSGLLKLIDFGVARTFKEHKSKDTVAMGSAGYAPPEQYGKGQTDARSDIYALGATLLHLLTNLPPVPLQTPTLGSVRRLNASIDAQTEQVIIKAMALSQDDRFQTAAAFEQALHACLDTTYVDPLPRSAPPVAPLPPPTPAPPLVPVHAGPVATNGNGATDVTQDAVSPLLPGGRACTFCGRVNKPGARFCSQCGNALRGLPPARLLISSPRSRWEHRLDRLPCSIGRRDPRQNHYPQIDLAEHDKGLSSRNHALIDSSGDLYRITDLDSTNGTMVNGTPLQANRPQTLKPGDKVKIGEVELEFNYL